MQSIAVAAQKYQNYLPQRSENCSEGHVYWTSHFSHVCIETHYDLGSSHPSASPTKNYDYFNSFVPAVQDLPGTSLDWKKMICCQKPGFWETDWKKNDLEGYQVEEALLFTVAIWREQHIPKYPTISLQQINTTMRTPRDLHTK
jgi:hypothetical protein